MIYTHATIYFSRYLRSRVYTVNGNAFSFLLDPPPFHPSSGLENCSTKDQFLDHDTFTDFLHGSLRFRKRFKPTSSRHFRFESHICLTLILFLFIFFFNSRSKEQNVEIVGWISKRGNSWQTFTLHTSGEQIRIFVPVQLEYLFCVGNPCFVQWKRFDLSTYTDFSVCTDL